MAYINYNANPKNLKTSDCVIRALSKATGKSWDEVYKELFEIGYKKKRLLNDSHVYNQFLKDNHFIKSSAKRNSDGKMITIEDFTKQSDSKKVYVIHTRKHLTVVMNNDIYDTWNTSREKAGKYYFKSI